MPFYSVLDFIISGFNVVLPFKYLFSVSPNYLPINKLPLSAAYWKARSRGIIAANDYSIEVRITMRAGITLEER